MIAFLTLLAEHLIWYLSCLAIVAITCYWLMRRHFFSLIDPLFYILIVNEAFCVADVLFMYRFGMTGTAITVNYLLTESALFVGILQFGIMKRAAWPSLSEPRRVDTLTSAIAYRMAAAIFILMNLLIYLQRGIPVLKESRNEIYRQQGWGMVERLMDVLLVVIVYYLIDLLRRRRWKASEWGVAFAVLAIEVLSGAKIAVLQLFFIAGLTSYFNGTVRKYFSVKSRLFRVSGAVALMGALLVITIQASSNSEGDQSLSAVGRLVLRLVTSGDTFIYAYPDGYADQLDGSNPVGAVLKDYLTTFRIASPDNLPAHLGVQIVNHFTGRGDEFQTNAKHNLFGYVYFGFWGSIVYSYLVGSSIGWVRYGLRRKLPQNWMGGVVFILLSLGTIYMISEPDDLNYYTIGIMVGFVPLALTAWIVARAVWPAPAVPPAAPAQTSEA
jgi:hypothetical protein